MSLGAFRIQYNPEEPRLYIKLIEHTETGIPPEQIAICEGVMTIKSVLGQLRGQIGVKTFDFEPYYPRLFEAAETGL